MRMEIRTVFDELFFSTIRIEAHPEGAKRRQFGTGFLVARETGVSPTVFLVTCHHVVRGCESGVFYFMKAEHGVPLMEWHAEEINHLQLGWAPHPDKNVDLAVLCINPLI